MIEGLPVAVVSDDVNNPEAVAGCLLLRAHGIPVHAQILVTNDVSDGFMPIVDFSNKYRRILERFESGLHVSLFSGEFPHDLRGRLGDRGSFHRLLHWTEELGKLSRLLGKSLDSVISYVIEKDNPYIQQEIRRQMWLHEKLIGPVTYASPHHGIHFIDTFERAYSTVLSDFGVPHRRAAQYRRLPTSGSFLRFYDRFNNEPNLTEDMVIDGLRDIAQAGVPTEICLHVGNSRYGKRQVEVFTSRRVLDVLHTFALGMPHHIIADMDKARRVR